MNKTSKLLIFAISLVVFGLLIFFCALWSNDWDFTILSTTENVHNSYEITENFSDISIKADTADILFALAQDGKCRVELYEKTRELHTVLVEDNTLSINVVNQKKWYDYISFGFSEDKITVYLPKAEYDSLFINTDTSDIEIPSDFSFESIDISLSTGDTKSYSSADSIKISSSTGDICVENVNSKQMELSVSTGDVTVSSVSCEGKVQIDVSTGKAQLTNLSCASLVSNGNTGRVTLTGVIVSGALHIERSTGDIKFDSCDANELHIKTSTGDVTGTLLSGKYFVPVSDTGDISTPAPEGDEVCEITTSTGDIEIEIKK